MRWVMVLAAAAMPTALWAEDWAALDAAGVTTALTGKIVTYEDGSTQDFKADGQTIYNNGRDSLGQWAVRGDQYCSVWPPSDIWACYGVATQGASVKFIAADGSETLGLIAP